MLCELHAIILIIIKLPHYSPLTAQLANHDKDKSSLQMAKGRLRSQDEALAQLQWEHEVLVQRFAQVCSMLFLYVLNLSL